MYVGAKPEVFRFAEKLRINVTEAEKNLWEFLRLKPKSFKFRRQHPFGQYILDFYCHRAQLSIEIDGEYHDAPEQKELDLIRTTVFEQQGVHEIRFTNEEVLDHFEEVKTFILDKLESKSSGQPSLEG